MDMPKFKYVPYSHYLQIYMILEHVLLVAVQQNKVGKAGHWMVSGMLDKHLFGAELHNQLVLEFEIKIFYYL